MREGAKTSLARRLRQSPNAPEDIAWAALRTLRGQGFPVRRQYPIGPFVVDFAIVRARLIIEVDGGAHAIPGVAERDHMRQQEIESLGWRVLRVSTEIAMSKDQLLAMIQRELRI